MLTVDIVVKGSLWKSSADGVWEHKTNQMHHETLISAAISALMRVDQNTWLRVNALVE